MNKAILVGRLTRDPEVRYWGGLVKMKKKERKQNMGRKGRTFLSIVGMAALHSLLIGVQVMAAPQDGSAIIE